jgi:hypothetical protein
MKIVLMWVYSTPSGRRRMKAGSPGAKVGATPVGALMWFTSVAALRSVVKTVCLVNGWMKGGETATGPGLGGP